MALRDQYMLSLPPGWRDKIKIEAGKEHRSMNAEITHAIETAMRLKGVEMREEAANEHP